MVGCRQAIRHSSKHVLEIICLLTQAKFVCLRQHVLARIGQNQFRHTFERRPAIASSAWFSNTQQTGSIGKGVWAWMAEGRGDWVMINQGGTDCVTFECDLNFNNTFRQVCETCQKPRNSGKQESLPYGRLVRLPLFPTDGPEPIFKFHPILCPLNQPNQIHQTPTRQRLDTNYPQMANEAASDVVLATYEPMNFKGTLKMCVAICSFNLRRPSHPRETPSAPGSAPAVHPVCTVHNLSILASHFIIDKRSLPLSLWDGVVALQQLHLPLQKPFLNLILFLVLFLKFFNNPRVE